MVMVGKGSSSVRGRPEGNLAEPAGTTLCSEGLKGTEWQWIQRWPEGVVWVDRDPKWFVVGLCY